MWVETLDCTVCRRGRRPRSCRSRPRRRGRRAGGDPSLDMMAPIGNNCLTDCLPVRSVGAHKRKHSPPEVPSQRGEAGSPLRPLARSGTAGPPPGPARFRCVSAGEARPEAGSAPRRACTRPRCRRSSTGDCRCRRSHGLPSAAFFDLDRTLLRGASGPVIGEALKAAGVTDRSIPGEQLVYRIYDLFGENRPSMEVTRRAVRFASGWVQASGAGGRRAGGRGAGRRWCSPSPGRSSTSTARPGGRSCSPPPRPTTW